MNLNFLMKNKVVVATAFNVFSLISMIKLETNIYIGVKQRGRV